MWKMSISIQSVSAGVNFFIICASQFGMFVYSILWNSWIICPFWSSNKVKWVLILRSQANVWSRLLAFELDYVSAQLFRSSDFHLGSTEQILTHPFHMTIIALHFTVCQQLQFRNATDENEVEISWATKWSASKWFAIALQWQQMALHKHACKSMEPTQTRQTKTNTFSSILKWRNDVKFACHA